MRTAIRPSARRPGFTLLELLIVIVLFGVVMGSMMMVIRKQQGFYRSAGEMMELRSQANQALGVLPRDLRAVSSAGSDITAMSDSGITFRSQLGSSVVCAYTSTIAVVPPSARLMKGHRLTVWREAPAVGDQIMVYDDGDEPSEVDDVWRTYNITAIAQGTVNTADACLPATGFVTVADTANSWRFTISGTFSPTIVQGAPIRFARKVRYALYQAADAEWYLGYQDSTAAGWSDRGPVSGPHRAYTASDGESGLSFVYFDDAENELDPTNPANLPLVARVDVTVRGRTDNSIDVPGKAREQFVDSLYASVNIRNRQ